MAACSVASVDVLPGNPLAANNNDKRERLSDGLTEHSLLPLAKRRRPSEPQPQQSAVDSTKGLKRTVSFATAEKKHEFDVTLEEKQQAWYDRSDYRDFQEDMQLTALSVRLGIHTLIKPGNFCLRGLESSLSPREGTIRKLRRRLLIETIIEEQVTQKELNNGRVCSQLICELSKALSAEALQDAVQRASQDASL